MSLVSKIVVAILFYFAATQVAAGKIYKDFPEKINVNESYVLYSHGYIVEGKNPRPVDKRFGWGLYDFPAVKQALSDDSYNLIAFHRPENTDPFVYANELSQQVRLLVDAGVEPGHITLIGFSRGAFITGLTSNQLSDQGVNTIILAGCGRLISKNHKDIKVYGHVLSVYEKTDRANTCKKLDQKSPDTKSFTEIQINTGLEHGAFYRPIPEWIKPVKRWIKERNGTQKEKP